MKVSEPAVAYDTMYVQELKEKLKSSIDAMADATKLEQCLGFIEGLDEEYTMREELARGITGEELLKGLRPRIKTLFQ